NQETRLAGIEGNVVELNLEIDPQGAREISVDVLCSPNREEYTSIKFYRHGLFAFNQNGRNIRQDALVLDTSRSSLLPDVKSRPPEVAPFELGDGELLKLQVFIDKSVVEVFANHRQCLALRVYPECEDSIGVSIRAQGCDAVLRSLEAWQMTCIWD
ncbi:MAG: GH32 C-terminal domain-containing protein, partial [Candidatus Poribacteria bacterium]|nr:GH32 C-terminal domain-containing protein [Candidatus Poribacteria bacterium]